MKTVACNVPAKRMAKADCRVVQKLGNGEQSLNKRWLNINEEVADKETLIYANKALVIGLCRYVD